MTKVQRTVSGKNATWLCTAAFFGINVVWILLPIAAVAGKLVIPERLFFFKGLTLITAFILFESLIVAGYAYVMIRLTRVELRRELFQRGVPICPGCGYDLQGINPPRCPECGTSLERPASQNAPKS